MKTVVGLGNPGDRYRDTRHNAGWWLADRLRAAWKFPAFEREGPRAATRGRVGGTPVRIWKPLTYMNRSGETLRGAVSGPGSVMPEDLLVLVDDVALEPGVLRLRARGSAGGHNGLASVEAALGTRVYARLRIGVGDPPPGGDLVAWVLGEPTPTEEEAIVGALVRGRDVVECWLEEVVQTAMNRFNAA